MKGSYLACLVVVLFAVAVKQVTSQTCHLREVDLCVAIGMFHYQSNGIPSDEEKINEWCETITEVRDCMGNFTAKCLSPLQREMMSLFTGADDIANQFCTAGSEIRANYLKHAECLADGAEGDEFKAQMRDIQVLVETMFDIPFKQRFPLMCCGLRRFRVATEEMTERNCGAESVHMIINIMQMVTTDLPETICQRYDPKSEECLAILPPPGTPSKGQDNKTQIGKLLDTVFGNL